jgi:hypothetical protein
MAVLCSIGYVQTTKRPHAHDPLPSPGRRCRDLGPATEGASPLRPKDYKEDAFSGELFVAPEVPHAAGDQGHIAAELTVLRPKGSEQGPGPQSLARCSQTVWWTLLSLKTSMPPPSGRSMWNRMSDFYLREIDRRFATMVDGVLEQAAIGLGERALDITPPPASSRPCGRRPCRPPA